MKTLWRIAGAGAVALSSLAAVAVATAAPAGAEDVSGPSGLCVNQVDVIVADQHITGTVGCVPGIPRTWCFITDVYGTTYVFASVDWCPPL